MSENLQLEMNVEVRFLQVVKGTIEEFVEGSTLDVDLRDIGINSITFIKLIVALEGEYDVEFEGVGLDIENFATLRELKEYVEKMLDRNE